VSSLGTTITMNFEAHGNINFIIKNSCVINRPNEGFNKEGVDILFDNILTYVKKKNLSQWVLVESLGKFAFPTPDALVSLARKYKISSEFGCVKIYAVCSSNAQKKFIIDAASIANIELSFCETEENALAACEKYLVKEYVV